MIPLRTERLLLRHFEPGDFGALLALHGDEELTRYIDWGPRDEEEVRATLGRKMDKLTLVCEGDGLGLAGILPSTGELIGDFTLEYQSARGRTAELGYMLHPDHHGKGYATEGAGALLRLAFEHFGMHRVVGILDARNEGSAGVLERLGMRREAHLVENEWMKGGWQSELVYAILAQEWEG